MLFVYLFLHMYFLQQFPCTIRKTQDNVTTISLKVSLTYKHEKMGTILTVC